MSAFNEMSSEHFDSRENNSLSENGIEFTEITIALGVKMVYNVCWGMEDIVNK